MTLANRIILFVFAFLTFASAMTEMEKIDALIDTVEKSGVIFIRNGSEYSSVDAAKHLKDKLNSAIRSPFAPKKSDWTAEMFIDRIASKSSTSGKDYLIKLPAGTKVKSKTWLTEKLNEIKAKNP